MKLFDILQLHYPSLSPSECKLHMAVWNGQDHPIDVFVAGDFEDWQQRQGKDTLNRQFVVSLINLSNNNWLFAGLFLKKGVTFNHSTNLFHYELNSIAECEDITGRLVVNFEKTFRNSYLNAEKWAQSLLVTEIKPECMTLSDFPGFKSINLSKRELDIVIQTNIPSWKGALSSVSGIYVISDSRSGKLYVGSAYGQDGIWGRWSQYSSSGHGNNKELRALINEIGAESTETFRFSILEVADIHASKNDILARESHWKRVLMARSHGFNAN